MSTQHTPGPWKVKANSTAVMAGRKQICSNVNAASVLPVNMAEERKIAEANARLIAAAPDLLEALQELLAAERANSLEIVGRDTDGHPLNAAGVARKKARAAIAKATGAI